MMDIDFIKWMCEKAEGFTVLNQEHDERIQLPSRDQLEFEELSDGSFYEVHIYPLLLQRAIEGVNRKYYNEGSKIYPWLILNSSHAIKVYFQIESGPSLESSFDWPCKTEDIDQAKESALKYIYAQEKTWPVKTK